MKKIGCSIILFHFSVIAFCQTLTHKEIFALSDPIMKAIWQGDTTLSIAQKGSMLENVHSEYLEYFLKIDNDGKISGTHILTDPGNTGVIYNVLRKIPISLFAKWQVEKAKNRTIVIPIIYEAGDLPDYIKDILHSRSDNSMLFTIERETATMIVLTPYYITYSGPKSNESTRQNSH